MAAAGAALVPVPSPEIELAFDSVRFLRFRIGDDVLGEVDPAAGTA